MDDNVIVSSAVVVPNIPDTIDTNTNQSPTHGHKRRASSTSSSDSKRPKLDPISQRSPPRSRHPPTRRITADIDEKKRGKRLFGGLLGALSQNGSSTAQKRRGDIDRRQREKLRRQTNDENEVKQQKPEVSAEEQRRRQRAWEREALATKHDNERMLAGFLRTETLPVLYYKPWEMRAEETEVIKRQVDDVERKIQAEVRRQENVREETRLAVDSGERGVEMSKDGDVGGAEVEDSTNEIPDKSDVDVPPIDVSMDPSPDEAPETTAQPNTVETTTAVAINAEETVSADTNGSTTEAAKDGVDAEDAIDQGEEDAVLY